MDSSIGVKKGLDKVIGLMKAVAKRGQDISTVPLHHQIHNNRLAAVIFNVKVRF